MVSGIWWERVGGVGGVEGALGWWSSADLAIYGTASTSKGKPTATRYREKLARFTTGENKRKRLLAGSAVYL